MDSCESMHRAKMTKMPQDRTIIHIDMDAFYAAIEQRDQPELHDRAVLAVVDEPSKGHGRAKE